MEHSYFEIDVHALTHKGREKEINEDQFIVAELNTSMFINETSLNLPQGSPWIGPRQGKLFVVADGLGGHPGGAEASTVAIDTLIDYLSDTMPWLLSLNANNRANIKDELERAMRRCESRIKQAADKNPEHKGMGTTLTLAYVLWPKLFVVHVGNSSAYLLRQGVLDKVTHDHTMAKKLVKEGRVEKSTVESSAWTSILWNVVGGFEESLLAPEVFEATLQDGDLLLLCTNGLNKVLSDEILKEKLKAPKRAHQLCFELISEAVAKENPDDVTAIVARFTHKEESGTIPKVDAENVTVLQGAPLKANAS